MCNCFTANGLCLLHNDPPHHSDEDLLVTKVELINAIFERMDVVWGEEGFDGEAQEYDWLLANYGITDEEDVMWMLILQHGMDDLESEDRDDEELMTFLENEQAVVGFLEAFLQKYQSSDKVYPR